MRAAQLPRNRRSGIPFAASGAVLLGPVGLLPGLSKKSTANAFVVFADATFRERKLDGNAVVRRAQAELAV